MLFFDVTWKSGTLCSSISCSLQVFSNMYNVTCHYCYWPMRNWKCVCVFAFVYVSSNRTQWWHVMASGFWKQRLLPLPSGHFVSDDYSFISESWMASRQRELEDGKAQKTSHQSFPPFSRIFLETSHSDFCLCLTGQGWVPGPPDLKEVEAGKYTVLADMFLSLLKQRFCEQGRERRCLWERQIAMFSTKARNSK